MHKLYFTIFLILNLFIPLQGLTQDIWDNERPNSISLEMLKPGFDIPGELSIISSVWFLSGSYEINEEWSIRPEIPFAIFKFEGFGDESTIGNVSVKVKYNKAESNFSFTAAAYLPTTSETEINAVAYASIADLNRLESFNPDIYGISVHSRYNYAISKNFLVRARSGLLYQIDKDDLGQGTLSLDYSIQFGYVDDKILVLAGLAGRMLVSSEGDFEISKARAIDQFGFSFTANTGRIRPGISLRIPLDASLERIINNSVGVHVNYTFK